MMNRKLKGFSLAELLISLLIISIVLSAAIPTLTKKSGANREFIWRWSKENNSAYFGVGSNQSAIIGADTIPLRGNSYPIGRIIEDDEVNITNVNYSNNGDKLILLKKSVYLDEANTNRSDFANSHISFYTAANDTGATTADIHYAGRIASDTHNLAFGIGTLQSLNNVSSTFKGENTAIGHYALLRNKSGSQNTALGEKTLSFNTDGSANTAVGFHSLFKLGDTGTAGGAVVSSQNTSLGYYALDALLNGEGNTAVGSKALAKNTQGDHNVAIGNFSLQYSTKGNNNVSIGAGSCGYLTQGDNNICIGNRSGLVKNGATNSNDNYGIYIGSSIKGDNDTPLIAGHTQRYNNTYDKELIVNAKHFQVRGYDSGSNIFEVRAYANDSTGIKGSGYGTNSKTTGYTGEVFMHLRGDKASQDNGISLSVTGEAKNINFPTINNKVVLGAYDMTSGAIDLSVNNRIAFMFPKSSATSTDCTEEVCLNTKTDKTFQINKYVMIKNENGTPTLKLNKQGFEVINTNNDFTFNIKSISGNLYTNLKDQFNFQIGNALTLSTNNDGILYTKNFDISKDKVYFKALDGKSVATLPGQYGSFGQSLTGNLYEDFKSIWQRLADLYGLVNQSVTSDERLKNISGDSKAGLKEINALEVKNYTYKADKENTPHVGVIAQQLQKVFPNSVFKGEDGYFRIKTEEIFYAMVNSIKELCAQIQDLTAKVTGLDKRITELEQQNAELKKQNAEFEKRLSKLEKSVK